MAQQPLSTRRASNLSVIERGLLKSSDAGKSKVAAEAGPFASYVGPLRMSQVAGSFIANMLEQPREALTVTLVINTICCCLYRHVLLLGGWDDARHFTHNGS